MKFCCCPGILWRSCFSPRPTVSRNQASVSKPTNWHPGIAALLRKEPSLKVSLFQSLLLNQSFCFYSSVLLLSPEFLKICFWQSGIETLVQDASCKSLSCQVHRASSKTTLVLHSRKKILSNPAFSGNYGITSQAIPWM